MRWLVLEEPPYPDRAGYDRVFSYLTFDADAFPHHYYRHRSSLAVYEESYRVLLEKLSGFSRAGRFFYKGVDLFWCYKKHLFDFLQFARLRYEVLRALLERHPLDRFEVVANPPNFFSPNLFQVLAHSELAADGRIGFVKAPGMRPLARAKESFLRKIYPAELRRGGLSSAEAGFFADFRKCRDVARRIGKARVVFYSSAKAPRLLFSGAVYQAAGRPGAAHRRAASEFLAEFDAARPFGGFSLGGLNAEALLAQKTRRLFFEDLPALLYQIDHIERFFAAARSLRSVLMDEDVSPSKNAFAQIARKFCVKTFVECHASLGHASGFVPLTADVILVWGEAQKEKLIAWGCDPNRIWISGCSRYSAYGAMDSRAVRSRVVSELGLDPAKKFVVMATTPVKAPRSLLIQEIRDILESMLAVAAAEAEAQFVVKTHPAETEENKRFIRNWIASRAASNIRLVESFDPLLLAKAADFLIIHRSTFAVDGFALGKPVICFRRGECRGLEEFGRYGAFFYAETADELARLTRRLLEAPQFPEGFAEARARLLNENGAEAPEAFIAKSLKEASVES